MENPDIKKRPSSRKHLINSKLFAGNRKLAIISAVIVLIGFGISTAIQMNKKPVTSKRTDPSVPIQPPAFELPTDDYEKVLYEADQLFIKSDHDGAIKRLAAYIPATTDQPKLYTLKSKIGYSYKAKGDFKNAIKWFEEAQQTNQPLAKGLYIEIAEAAEKLGDKPKAIEAYKKAIEVLNSSSSQAAKNIAATYQSKIESLGGQ